MHPMRTAVITAGFLTLSMLGGCELKKLPENELRCPDGRLVTFDDHPTDVIPPTNYLVASEFVHYHLVEEYLPLCKKYNLTLVLALYPEMVGSEALAHLLRQAHSEGVPVIAWPLLQISDDNWPNEFNAEKFAQQVEQYALWFECEDLKVRWFLADMEMPDRLSREFEKAFANGIGEGLADMIPQYLRPEEFAAAERTYQQMVDTWRQRGFYFAVVSYPFIIDDMKDGDRDLQDILGVPVTGVDWDYYGFMTYRSGMWELFGQEVGAWFSYIYAKEILENFGEQGVTGFGVVGYPDYREPEVLMEDIAAMRGAGLDRFVIYSMDLIMTQPDPEKWLDFSSVGPMVPEQDPNVENLRMGLALVDVMCDQYH